MSLSQFNLGQMIGIPIIEQAQDSDNKIVKDSTTGKNYCYIEKNFWIDESYPFYVDSIQRYQINCNALVYGNKQNSKTFTKDESYLISLNLYNNYLLPRKVSIYLDTYGENNNYKQLLYSAQILAEEQTTFSFSFKPRREVFNSIIVTYEVFESEYNLIESGNFSSNVISIKHCKMYNPFNLLDNDKVLKKIGIQAKPETKFIINDELITVGQSGIYEFLNGLVEVHSIQYLPTIDNSGNIILSNFILDYQY